jgi:hypothetical protein
MTHSESSVHACKRGDSRCARERKREGGGGGVGVEGGVEGGREGVNMCARVLVRDTVRMCFRACDPLFEGERVDITCTYRKRES